jgi:hypothetical protein
MQINDVFGLARADAALSGLVFHVVAQQVGQGMRGAQGGGIFGRLVPFAFDELGFFQPARVTVVTVLLRQPTAVFMCCRNAEAARCGLQLFGW